MPHSVQWFQMAKNQPKISSVQSFPTFLYSVSGLLRALHFQNLSNYYRHKYDLSIFTSFFENLIFGGFFDVLPNCEAIELELLYSKF